MACAVIIGAMSSTPSDAFYTLLDIQSLSFHIIGKARMSTKRLGQTRHWKYLTEGQSSIGSIKVDDGTLMMMPFDNMVPELIFNGSFLKGRLVSGKNELNNQNPSVVFRWIQD